MVRRGTGVSHAEMKRSRKNDEDSEGSTVEREGWNVNEEARRFEDESTGVECQGVKSQKERGKARGSRM